MVEQSDCISVQCVPVGRWRLMSQPVVAPLPNKKSECSCHADTAHISVSASEGVARTYPSNAVKLPCGAS